MLPIPDCDIPPGPTLSPSLSLTAMKIKNSYDMKILTKILANRLNFFFTCLIEKDQVGFVPKRQVGDAIRRIIQLQHIAHRRSLETMLLSLNVNNSFDTLSWNYRMTVLSLRVG